MASGDPKMMLRIPAEMKGWVEDQAKRNGASLNSEVLRCIRERMDRMVGPERAEGVDGNGECFAGAPRRRSSVNTDGDQQ